jgi:hypothetical protein
MHNRPDTRHPGQESSREAARRWRRKTNPDRPAPPHSARR